MQQGGPIVYAYAAANGYVWANCFFGKHRRCNKVGRSHMHMQLPMATPGPIIFLESTSDAIG